LSIVFLRNFVSLLVLGCVFILEYRLALLDSVDDQGVVGVLAVEDRLGDGNCDFQYVN
jgi:hypothetical protein